MTKPKRIEPKEPGHEPMPESGGTWFRDADGGLTPGDAQTAADAGLAWGDEPEEQPNTDPEAVATGTPMTETPQE